MLEIRRLLEASGPYFTLLEGDAAALEPVLAALGARPEATVRVFAGQQLGTPAALWEAFAGTLEFPDYFGMNWDAVDECLADLEWLPTRRVVLVFRDAGALLQKAPADLETLSDILLTTAEAWAEAGDPETPMSFHILLQDLGPGLDRWEWACRAGAIPFLRVPGTA